MSHEGESFKLHLDGYYVEQQRGQKINLVLEYGYAGVLPLEQMPDYRLIQMLVEEVLYTYEEGWIDIFWEVINRELVRRLLAAFPQLAWARCEFSIVPSPLLPIGRASIVEWKQDDLPKLAAGATGEFSRTLPDACWYGTPGAFNIGAPSCLLPALKGLYEKLQALPQDGEQPRVLLSFVPLQLQAPEGAYTELLALCEQHAAYDALILPRPAKHSLKRGPVAGKLSGIVQLGQREGTPKTGVVGTLGAAHHLLAELLGSPPGIKAVSTAEARRGFVVSPPSYDTLLVDERFAGGLIARGYPSDAGAFAGEPLELCFASRVDAQAMGAASKKVSEVLG